MKNKMILLFLIASFFLCGCWNYQELNDLAIVTGFAIDKKEDQYQISLLISNAKKASSSAAEGEAQTTIYDGVGSTLSEALKDIDLKTPRQLYLGHIAVVIVSQQVAENGFDDVVDLLMRAPESRKKFYFVLSEDENAKNILKILSPLESFPSQNITVNIKSSSEVQATSTDVYLSDFVSKSLSDGINPILTTVHTEGDTEKGSKEESLQQSKPDSLVMLGSIAIFKRDKLVGITTNDESMAINLINNKASKVSTKIDEHTTIAIESSKTNKKVVFKDGKPTIQLDIHMKGAIDEINEAINLEKPSTIKKISQQAKKYLEDLVSKAVAATQEKYRSDVFGFGSLIYKKNPTYFEKVEEQWDEYFYPALEVNANVKIDLHSKGSLEQTLKEKENEKNTGK